MNLFEDQNYILNLLKESNAILSGHFILSSGVHSDQYVQCAKLHEFPKVLKKFSSLLAQKINFLYPDLKIDCVASPAIGGILPGYEICCQLDCDQFFFAEKDSLGGFEFRRGFQVQPGKNYLVAEDVVTTGGAIKKVVDLIKSQGGNVVLVASFIDRSNGLSEKFDFNFLSLLKIRINTYQPDSLPDDLKVIPVVKPGSSKPTK